MSHFKGKYKSVAELTPILEMQLGQITPRPQLKFSSKTSFDTYTNFRDSPHQLRQIHIEAKTCAYKIVLIIFKSQSLYDYHLL